MKRETLFLKIAVILIGMPVLALCIFVVPDIARFAAEMIPELAHVQVVFLVFLYATAITFFFALYQTIKILSYIDKKKAFSDLSVKALKYIKYCGFIISILYAANMPLIFLMGERDDAPGIIAISLAIIFGSIAIAVFAAVLQKLLKNAIDIKSDNDLTI